MADPRYTYERTNVIKVIVQNSQNKILLIREPLTNEWMPGHWGLPGGKPLIHESLLEAYHRKIQGELGVAPDPEGLFKIEELLIENRTVLMFIFVTHLDQTDFQGEAEDYKWFDKDDLAKMDLAEFTEYYNKDLLLGYLDNPSQLIPLNLFDSLKYFEMKSDSDYQRWLESGTKKQD